MYIVPLFHSTRRRIKTQTQTKQLRHILQAFGALAGINIKAIKSIASCLTNLRSRLKQLAGPRSLTSRCLVWVARASALPHPQTLDRTSAGNLTYPTYLPSLPQTPRLTNKCGGLARIRGQQASERYRLADAVSSINEPF